MLKRGFDIGVSFMGLVVVAPVMLICAVLVKCSSSGPVLFRQQRVGRHFHPFEVLKFRTMVVQSNHRGAEITAGGDPRVTSVGRVLRKLKLDELPQLLNVLRGDMSFVGPRPEVPKYVEMFHEDYERLLSVRPGITDLASLTYCDEEAVLAGSSDPEKLYISEVLPAKISLSKQYLDQASLRLDLRVIVETVLRLFARLIPARTIALPHRKPNSGRA